MRTSLMLAAGATLLLGGGGCQCNPDLLDPPGEGFLFVYLALEDGAVEGGTLAELRLVAQRADVVVFNPDTGEEQLHTVIQTEQELVAPASARGVPLLLFAASIPYGEIRQVRMVVDDASLTTQEAEGNVTRSVKSPSGSESGIKLVPHDSPLLPDQGSLAIVGTLELGDQITTPPGQGLVFKPVVPAERLDRATLHDQLGPDEVLLAVAARDFPLTGARIERAKALDLGTLQIRNIEIDAATGAPSSFELARADHEAAWRDTRGALHPELARALAAVSPDATVDAFVLVDVPAQQPFLFDADTPAEWDAAHGAYVAAAAQRNQPAVDALAVAMQAAGAEITRVERHPARIEFRARRSLLEDELAFLPGALLVGRNQQPVRTGTRAARDQIQEPLWPAHDGGAGQDLRIAIIEPTACINDRHEHFQRVTFERSEGMNGRCTDELGIADRHSTAAAGAAAGVLGSDAFIGLFAGRMFESNEGIIVEEVLERNAHFINLSYLTSPDERTVYDSAVFLDRVFVANGSGNLEGASGDAFPAHCEAYNALCVGGYYHNETLGIGNFGDDRINSGSFWPNNPDTGREEPDLVGSYTQRLPSQFSSDTLGQVGREPWAGTSFATPSVLGLGALITANFLADLIGHPTLLRAVLLASANHSVDDFEGDDTPIAVAEDGIDDKSGAGVPRGDRALAIMSDGRSFHGYLDRVSDFDADGLLRHDLRLDVRTGDVVRVALTWDNARSRSRPPRTRC